MRHTRVCKQAKQAHLHNQISAQRTISRAFAKACTLCNLGCKAPCVSSKAPWLLGTQNSEARGGDNPKNRQGKQPLWLPDMHTCIQGPKAGGRGRQEPQRQFTEHVQASRVSSPVQRPSSTSLMASIKSCSICSHVRAHRGRKDSATRQGVQPGKACCIPCHFQSCFPELTSTSFHDHSLLPLNSFPFHTALEFIPIKSCPWIYSHFVLPLNSFPLHAAFQSH
eukprot:1161342-Pelagomonas_calceolata.AAC.10